MSTINIDNSKHRLLNMILESKLIASLTNIKLLCIVLLFTLTRIPELIATYIFADFGFLYWLVFTMILDFITGVTKVWKNQGWAAVTSKGFRDTVSKSIQYISFLMLVHIVTHVRIDDKVVMGDWSWLTKYAFEFLIFIEIKSVYENLVEINPEFDVLKTIIKQLNEFLPKKKK